MANRFAQAVLAAVFVLTSAVPAAAQSAAPSSAPKPPSGSPAPYAAFVKEAEVQSGLIPIVRKNGKVYLALQKSQLGTDFIETSVPSTGLGGLGPAAGEPYVAPARIIRFERVDDNVIIRWPNEYTITQPNTAPAYGVRESLPSSIVAVAPIVAQDDNTVVISAEAFLGDVADFTHSIQDVAHTNPLHAYHLDPSRSFFAKAKAFPQNDVIRVDQTWQSADPDFIDNAPDPRSIEVVMTYNLIQAPADGYMPRIYDPRVGYFSQPLMNFASDDITHRDVHYLARWNFGPRTSAAPMTTTHPIVYYLSRDIPEQYRSAVRGALLTWNDAFRRVGILNAVQVLDQPDDPNWDGDDIRYNVVRWVDTSQPAYGAEALLITDPRTGEELNVGVNMDAIEGLAGRTYKYIIAPARGLPDSMSVEHAYVQQVMRAVTLHESGHDMGLQHNFIASEAYTARNLQSKAFTDRYGVANSVMEYSPLNIWPKKMPQGEYQQLVLGPYDYYAIHYGYGYIAGARTAQGELPVLRQWASRWTQPYYRFASDEDTSFSRGHAIDPRVVTNDLTDQPLQWAGVEMHLMHNIMNAVANRFPGRGDSFEEARRAFMSPLRSYLLYAGMPAHTIGGEYLSRAANGDPHSTAPLTPVPRTQERMAWKMLDDGLFADAPWRFNPNVLNRLTYNEYSSLGPDATWAYAPTPRHDVPVVEIVGDAQNSALNELFAPLRLQRIDDLATKYASGSTMSLTDLFDWAQSGIFGDIASGRVANDGVIRRNLQIAYAKRLGDLWTAPKAGTPADAQALARLELQNLRYAVSQGMRSAHMDELTRAHLGALDAIANQALQAHATIAPSEAPSEP
jgi:Met-zincin/Domain of unknown function (DUF5117)